MMNKVNGMKPNALLWTYFILHRQSILFTVIVSDNVALQCCNNAVYSRHRVTVTMNGMGVPLGKRMHWHLCQLTQKNHAHIIHYRDDAVIKVGRESDKHCENVTS